jgi:hypothetical protein
VPRILLLLLTLCVNSVENSVVRCVCIVNFFERGAAMDLLPSEMTMHGSGALTWVPGARNCVTHLFRAEVPPTGRGVLPQNHLAGQKNFGGH